MPPAPVVQSLQDLVGQYTAAEAPEEQQITNEISSNDSSGQAQVEGLNTDENNAFSKIAGEANARGATFSGFTPNDEASYVGGTYLPALAKLQTTIAATRNSLLGQTATLNTSANTDALDEQKTEQSALDTYNEDEAEQEAENQRTQEQIAATEQDDAAERAAEEQDTETTASADASKTAASELDDIASSTASTLAKETGGDGYVSPQSYAAAGKEFMAQGYSAAQFDALLGQFKNPNNKNYTL